MGIVVPLFQAEGITSTPNMKVVAVLCSLMALAAAAPSHLVAAPAVVGAPALVRTPQFDSAVIKSDRLGGNFAYSTHEAHAYAAVSPVVSRVATPVAVSYHATPVVAHAAPVVAHAAPVVAAPYAHAYAAPYAHSYAAPYAAPYAHW